MTDFEKGKALIKSGGVATLHSCGRQEQEKTAKRCRTIGDVYLDRQKLDHQFDASHFGSLLDGWTAVVWV
jgi:hypothetical protein